MFPILLDCVLCKWLCASETQWWACQWMSVAEPVYEASSVKHENEWMVLIGANERANRQAKCQSPIAIHSMRPFSASLFYDKRQTLRLRIIAQWIEWLWNRRVKHRVIRSFARTAHSCACSALLASLARSAALTHSLPSIRERDYFIWIERVDFIQFQPTVQCS